MKAQTLKEYIKSEFNGSQTKFAKHVGVLPQQITQWLNKDSIVVGGKMYSFRRDLK